MLGGAKIDESQRYQIAFDSTVAETQLVVFKRKLIPTLNFLATVQGLIVFTYFYVAAFWVHTANPWWLAAPMLAVYLPIIPAVWNGHRMIQHRKQECDRDLLEAASYAPGIIFHHVADTGTMGDLPCQSCGQPMRGHSMVCPDLMEALQEAQRQVGEAEHEIPLILAYKRPRA